MPEAPAGEAVLGEELDLEPLGALEAPGGGDDAPREHGLERALRRQILEQHRLECFERSGVLTRQHDVFFALEAHA